MALKFVVDSLDAVPESQRSFYVERDGKHHLDLDGYEDPTNLKSALSKERDRANAAEKQAKAWSAMGKTPDEISALLETQRQAEIDKATKNGEWDKLRAQMTEAHQSELKRKDESLQARDKAIAKHLIDSAAAQALAKLKGSTALLMPHVRAAVKVVEDGGEYTVRVLDAAGSPRVNGKGEFLSIEDLVSEMRQSEIYGPAFEATGTTGSGAGSSAASGARTMKRSAYDALKPVERAKAMARVGKGELSLID
jgi:multidrug efflux pump subunit AcrA (membrane-fusion protein)